MAETDSYIEGLRAELAGAVQSGNKDHEKAVRSELDRVGGNPVETAVAPVDTESRTS